MIDFYINCRTKKNLEKWSKNNICIVWRFQSTEQGVYGTRTREACYCCGTGSKTNFLWNAGKAGPIMPKQYRSSNVDKYQPRIKKLTVFPNEVQRLKKTIFFFFFKHINIIYHMGASHKRAGVPQSLDSGWPRSNLGLSWNSYDMSDEGERITKPSKCVTRNRLQ